MRAVHAARATAPSPVHVPIIVATLPMRVPKIAAPRATRLVPRAATDGAQQPAPSRNMRVFCAGPAPRAPGSEPRVSGLQQGAAAPGAGGGAVKGQLRTCAGPAPTACPHT